MKKQFKQVMYMEALDTIDHYYFVRSRSSMTRSGR